MVDENEIYEFGPSIGKPRVEPQPNAASQSRGNNFTLTYSLPLSSKRLRVIPIFVIRMPALILYTHGRSAKQKRHQAILDSLAWADMPPLWHSGVLYSVDGRTQGRRWQAVLQREKALSFTVSMLRSQGIVLSTSIIRRPRTFGFPLIGESMLTNRAVKRWMRGDWLEDTPHMGNHHGIIGGRCARLPPLTMTGIISISPIAVTTGYAPSALYGPLMIKLPMPGPTILYPSGCFTFSAHTLPKYCDSVGISSYG
ncbi:hypothetical protein ARMGADRAFT_1038217 [Armillaria gallica]|uniref:Uncharacterized protein n=1 Tax=Armillaria gallica TaxID=47427 RepID=A0A2H3D3M5_ARMGA|nr:hypothetical protein ARMGADRAFT_1038217 [Armillaria gallica]